MNHKIVMRMNFFFRLFFSSRKNLIPKNKPGSIAPSQATIAGLKLAFRLIQPVKIKNQFCPQ